MIVFLNGQFVSEAEAVVSVNDRGFLLGDGLFETFRVVNGRPFRMTQHLERLAHGADFLKIKIPFTQMELEKFAGRLIGKNKMPEAILRLTLTRGPGKRGYTPDDNHQPTLVMTLQLTPPKNEQLRWSLITSSFRVSPGDALASFKTTSKILHIMARAEAIEKNADEALLVDTNNEVAETAAGNIFWISQNKVCTVPTEHGGLPGITSAVILEICQTLGLPTSLCAIKPEALRKVEGLFVTQSVLGIVPVISLDGESIMPSPLVDKITDVYNQMLTRE